MPTAQHFTNPFEPQNRTTWDVVSGTSVKEVVSVYLGPGSEFDTPTICLVNGEPVLRAEWEGAILRDHDVVQFITQVNGIEWWLLAMLVVGVAAGVMLVPKPPNPLPEADSVYSLNGRRNSAKPNNPIECPYGKNRLWPSYAANPYTKFIGNDQWQYQLFCLGQGEYEIEKIQVENTDITSYSDIQYQIVPPGGTITLFPDNVDTSEEVGDLRLYGNDNPDGGGASTYNPATGVTEYVNWQGPFAANAPHTLTSELEFDITFPGGLYNSDNKGNLKTNSAIFVIQVRQIDNDGVPVGGWFSPTGLGWYQLHGNTTTPVRRTIKATGLTQGRYEVQMRKASKDDEQDSSWMSRATWTGLRAYLPSTRQFGDVTLLAVQARATDNFNDRAANRINIIATRKLPTWDGSSWTAPVATRNPVWALCDVFRALYGANLSALYLDLPKMVEEAAGCASRDDNFDFVFDQRQTVWEAAQVICAAFRATPIQVGSLISVVRDTARSIPVALFGPHNIVEDSFSIDMELTPFSSHDGLLAKYISEDTWEDDAVPCVLSDETGEDMEDEDIVGVTNRAQAFREGMYRRAVRRLRTTAVSFTTGMEGRIPTYGDLIAVSYDLPRWGKSGQVVSIASNVVTLSEDVEFGAGSHVISFSTKRGGFIGPYPCTPGTSANQVVLSAAPNPNEFSFDDKHERQRFAFGTSEMWSGLCLVQNVQPSNKEEVVITASPYVAEIYAVDAVPVPAPNAEPTPYVVPDVPVVGDTLQVNLLPNSINWIQASWNVALGAKEYVVEFAHTDNEWQRVGKTPYTFIQIPAIPDTMRVRVAAIGKAQGLWSNVWEGFGIPALDMTKNLSLSSRSSAQNGLRWTLTWDADGVDFVSEGNLYVRYYRTGKEDQALEAVGVYANGEMVIDFAPADVANDYQVAVWHLVEVAGQAVQGAAATFTNQSVYPDTNAPANPTSGDVQHNAASFRNILTWVDPTDEDFAYVMVRRKVGAGSWMNLQPVQKGVQRFVDTELEQSATEVTYSYVLWAYDSTGNHLETFVQMDEVVPGQAQSFPIVWKGELSSPPSNPVQNWVFRDIAEGNVYIYNNGSWELMVQDGDGTVGADGKSVWITYNESTDVNSPPSAPPTNGNGSGWSTTPSADAVWISQKLSVSVDTGTWGPPQRIKGFDGEDAVTYRLVVSPLQIKKSGDGVLDSSAIEATAQRQIGAGPFTTYSDAYVVLDEKVGSYWNTVDYTRDVDDNAVHGGGIQFPEQGVYINPSASYYRVRICTVYEEPSHEFSGELAETIIPIISEGQSATVGAVTNSNGLVWTIDKNGVATPSGTTTDLTVTFTKAGAIVARRMYRVTRHTTLRTLTIATLAGSEINPSHIALSSVGSATAALTVTFTHTPTGVIATESFQIVTSGTDGTNGTDGTDGTDGNDALVAFLTNESTVFEASLTGVVSSFTGGVSQLKLFEGAVDVTSSVTSSGANASGVTYTRSGTTVTVTGMSAWVGYIDIWCTYKGQTFTKRYSLAKAKQGNQGVQGLDGGPGPGIVFRGNYLASEFYYHTSTRRDVVKYNNHYYLTNNPAKNGLNTWGTPGGGDWAAFGSNFDSVATKLLLAEDATILSTLTIGGSAGEVGGNASVIQSGNYEPGETGFKINHDGNAEFNELTLRQGIISAGDILFYDPSNLVYDASLLKGEAGLAIGGADGWQVWGWHNTPTLVNRGAFSSYATYYHTLTNGVETRRDLVSYNGMWWIANNTSKNAQTGWDTPGVSDDWYYFTSSTSPTTDWGGGANPQDRGWRWVSDITVSPYAQTGEPSGYPGMWINGESSDGNEDIGWTRSLLHNRLVIPVMQGDVFYAKARVLGTGVHVAIDFFDLRGPTTGWFHTAKGNTINYSWSTWGLSEVVAVAPENAAFARLLIFKQGRFSHAAVSQVSMRRIEGAQLLSSGIPTPQISVPSQSFSTGTLTVTKPEAISGLTLRYSLSGVVDPTSPVWAADLSIGQTTTLRARWYNAFGFAGPEVERVFTKLEAPPTTLPLPSVNWHGVDPISATAVTRLYVPAHTNFSYLRYRELGGTWVNGSVGVNNWTLSPAVMLGRFDALEVEAVSNDTNEALSSSITFYAYYTSGGGGNLEF